MHAFAAQVLNVFFFLQLTEVSCREIIPKIRRSRHCWGRIFTVNADAQNLQHWRKTVTKSFDQNATREEKKSFSSKKGKTPAWKLNFYWKKSVAVKKMQGVVKAARREVGKRATQLLFKSCTGRLVASSTDLHIPLQAPEDTHLPSTLPQ